MKNSNLIRVSIILSTLAMMVVGVTPVAQAQAAATCLGETVTVDLALGQLPTAGPDVVAGTPGDDSITAGDGDDLVCGLGGNDRIWGQDGDDQIDGGDGDDRIRGGAGNDKLVGGDGADDMAGGSGDDRVLGGEGDDTKLRGGTGDDLVFGGPGNDALISGNGGEDSLEGDEGNDVLVGGARPDRLNGGPGNDVVRGLKGADLVLGGTGDDELFGGPQPDVLDGGEGTDICNGGTTGEGAPETDTGANCETEINIEAPGFVAPPTPTPGPIPTLAPVPAATPAPVAGLPVSSEAAGDPGASSGIVSPGPIPVPGPPEPPGPPPQAGLLTAADVDDNLNFDFFTGYLERTQQELGQPLPSANLVDRIRVTIKDGLGNRISNARVDIVDDNGTVATAYTSSAGVTHVFPKFFGLAPQPIYKMIVSDGVVTATTELSVANIEADGGIEVAVPEPVGTLPAALDVAFVIDTTGSMGDELEYLKVEFASIVDAVERQYPNVDMRFGLVAYRDIGDDYVTRSFEFDTADGMLANLERQSAAGGGNYPEAMEAALADAAQLDWRGGNVARVVILNADAPPHDENLQAALDQGAQLREQGVRIYTLAASGVADTAEYLMRVMAATTGGRHLFLTDDSGIGGAHQLPKVACYVVTRLDQLLERVLATELAGERLEPSPSEVIRTVGEYDNGVCGDLPQPGPLEVIGSANIGGPSLRTSEAPFSYSILESYPEQIMFTFFGPPLACLTADAVVYADDLNLYLSLQLGTPLSDEPIVCAAVIEENSITVPLTEGIDGRTIVQGLPPDIG